MKKRNKSREDLKTRSSEVYRSESREILSSSRSCDNNYDSYSDDDDDDDDDESEVASEYEMNELEHSTPMSLQYVPSWRSSKSDISPLPIHNPRIVNTISVVSILLYVATAACIYVVYYTDIMVYVPPISALSKDPSAFNHIQARRYLQQLVAFGPRVVGSEVNEVQVPEYLRKELMSMQSELVKSTETTLEIDTQHVTGEFHHRFLHGFTNVYSNVTNIVARVSPKHLSSEDLQVTPSILVNAHFDSFITSPGASDDGVGVAVMLEAIRVFVNNGMSKRYPVIFLFNGAEENNQQASHGFISQHKWSKTVRSVINLEAIGTGGRELVFQCNSAWIASLYTKYAPYPSISVLAHEFFKHVLWRVAYTDWATFIEHGRPGIVGIDTAYTDNGYVYHTPSDVEKYIPDKTIQHTGVNLLGMLKALQLPREKKESTIDGGIQVVDDDATIKFESFNLMDASEQTRQAEANLYKNYRISSGVVFYDILGIVGIVYSGWNVVIIHLTIAVGALFVALRATSGHDIVRSIGRVCVPFTAVALLLIAVLLSGLFDHINDKDFTEQIVPHLVYPLIGTIVVTTLLYMEEIRVACRKKLYVFLATVVGNAVFGFFISGVAPMKWYNGGLLCAMIMYIPPALVMHEYAQSSVGLRSVETNHRAGLIFVAIMVIALTFAGVLTCYVSALNLLLGCIAYIIFEHAQTWMLYWIDSETAWITAVFLRSVMLMPGFVFLLQTGRSLITLICAMFGKTGTVVPSEVIVAVLVGFAIASLSIFPLIGVSIPDVMSPVFNADRYIKTLGKMYQNQVDEDQRGAVKRRPKSNIISKHFFNVKRKQTQCIELTPSRTSVLIVLGTVTTLAVLYNMTVPSYSTDRPKRLWIQHLKRSYINKEGTKINSDSGLWVQAFDTQGMKPIIEDAVARGIDKLDGRYFTSLRKGEDNCGHWTAECYIHWPYGFAVAEAMRESFYIPTPEPPVQQDEALRVQVLRSNPNKHETSMPLVQDTSCVHRVQIIRFEAIGPASQFVAIKDDGVKPRLIGYHVAVKTHHKGKEDTDQFAHESLKLRPMPRLRPDGVYFFQVGFGLCDKDSHCTLQMALATCDDESKEPLDISVYGHYHDISSTPEMEELDMHLPVWSKGAEWSHHVSHLVNFKV